LAVPTACEVVPRAIPLAIELLIRKTLKISGAISAPNIPVITILKTLRPTMPSSISLAEIPIGVVVDLGRREFINRSDRPKRCPRTKTEIRADKEPKTVPVKIDSL
jgi:hypothetical protein